MHKKFYVLLVSFCLLLQAGYAQVYPVSLEERVQRSSIIAVVRVIGKHSYWDARQENIYTRNHLRVVAYLKGHSNQVDLMAISPGGVVGNQAEHVCPAEEYELNREYLVMLKDNEAMLDDKQFRQQNPSIKQCLSYAGPQSVLALEQGRYMDLLVEAPRTEAELLTHFQTRFGLIARTPAGSNFNARPSSPGNSQPLGIITSITDGTGSTPASGFVAGTIPTNNEIIINGALFGAATGSLQFSNVNTGGTSTTSTIATDIISWSPNQIRARIPGLAGTGTVRVLDDLGAELVNAPITIKWGEINVENTFQGFVQNTRQQVHLFNKNGLGGYTFQYSANTTANTNGLNFANTLSARLAFERALRTWRCSTLVNYDVDLTTSTNALNANDDINVVVYDNTTLSAGALAVCTSRFTANASSPTCTQGNTVWQLKEMDIRVLPNPTPTTTWNYGSNNPAFNQFDFQTVMLHEVGHGHGLTHINLNSEVMFFSVSNGVSKRIPSANEIEAGTFRIARSVNNCLNQAGFTGFSPHVAISPAACSFLIPLRLVDFLGTRQQNTIQLTWITEAEQQVKGFVVEKSVDGRNFTDFDFVPARNLPTQQTYRLNDDSPIETTVYYRLRMVDLDGKFTYSRVLVFRPDRANWSIFPNPAKSTIWVSADASYPRGIDMQILDVSGRVVVNRRLPALVRGESIPVALPGNLARGFYQVRMVSGTDVLFTQRLMKD